MLSAALFLLTEEAEYGGSKQKVRGAGKMHKEKPGSRSRCRPWDKVYFLHLVTSGRRQPHSCKQGRISELGGCCTILAPGAFPWHLVTVEHGNRAGGGRWGSPGNTDILALKDFHIRAASPPGVLRDFLASGGLDIIITLCPRHCWDAVCSSKGMNSLPVRSSPTVAQAL